MKKRAFSLLELIVVLFISSILILIINNLVFFNFKVSEESFKQEMDYKNSTNCMLYIENLIRKSEKIEKTNKESNFKIYVRNDNGLSWYWFEQIGKNLYVNIKNTKSSSKKEAAIPIGYCKSSKITYDKEKKGFSVRINFIEKSSSVIYKTFIGKTYEYNF